MVLFIALIVLVALMLASISLVRSVDTANIIAGNLAFRQTAVQAGDYGIEAAALALPTIVTAPDTDVTPSKNGTPTYWYYSTRRETDASGAPTASPVGTANPAPIVWNNLPVAQTVAGNTVQVVIERLCNGTPPITNLAANCFYEGSAEGGSKKPGQPVFASVTSVFYRVTAYVAGPRNTVSVVQAIVSR